MPMDMVLMISGIVLTSLILVLWVATFASMI